MRRALWTGLLSLALALSVTHGPVAPAFADGEVIIESPPVPNGTGTEPPLTITQGGVVNGATSIVVDNPGGTAPTSQDCVPLVTESEVFCLGQSGDALYPNGTIYPPIGPITNAPTAPGELPGDKMDWILPEAYAATSDAHGVANDDMLRAFGRPEIRAYVQTRLQGIIDKVLYGQTLTQPEQDAYDALEQYYHQQQVEKANDALAEYDLWSANPCFYPVPDPPAGLPYVPNPVATSASCSAVAAVQFYTLTRGTPPAETFEKWAAYRHPTNLAKFANDTRIRDMVGRTGAALIGMGAYAAVALAGAGIGIGVLTTLFVIEAAQLAVLGDIAFTVFTSAAAAALAPIAIVVVALIILAVAIWQMVEDAKPGEQIRDRAARAAENDDPLGVRARIADYAGLDYEHRVDPPGQTAAIVHQQAFKDGLRAQVAEWLMFDQGGDPLVDPGSGYTVTESQPDDLHFMDGDQPLPLVTVRAPDGSTDRNGHPIDSYRVLFSRGWPMVSEHRSDTGVWGAYLPRLSILYVDQDGDIAQMQMVRHQEGDDPAKLEFLTSRPGLAPAETDVKDDEWTFTEPGGALRTVGLAPFDPVLLPVNVVPSAQGIMIADNVVRLDANLSTPGQALPGSYEWTLERIDESGAVVETVPVTGQATVFKRILTPGRYRATARYTVTGPPQFTRSGTVEFTMAQPAPEVLSAQVRDDRVLDGSLFLDLRLLQSTRTDTFDVHVDWANDARGNVVSKDYTVQCQDSGGDVPTCDTGPMILPDTAPTNENWSETPTFRIPDDQDFLPEVTVTITNGYGGTTTRSFPIEGDHRPSYATMTPYAAMPAGKFSRVDVVEVFPSPLLTESQNLTILPYVQTIADQLPEGVTPDIEKRDGHWYLQLRGAPQADAIGSYTFYFPFEQEPLGKALRPPPALANVEIKSSLGHGYRAVLLGTPTAFLDRQYRNVYPDYHVQVDEVIDDDEDFTPFTGTVMCKLTAGPTTVFDKPCTPDAEFPWPDEKVSDTMNASVYLVSGTQPLAADGPYEVDLATRFVDPTVTQVAAPDGYVRFQMSLRDLNAIQPPFGAAGYTVTCSQDSGAFAPCLDNGELALPKTPGDHTLAVRVKAADGATTTETVTWNGGSPPPPPATLTADVTAHPATARALRQRFTLAVGQGGPVAPPYAAKGVSVTCVADGKPVTCFADGTLSLLRVPGRHVLTTTVHSADGQTVTRRVEWRVATPPVKLDVRAPATARPGDRVKVRVGGLLPHERYVVKLGSHKVAHGHASDRGRATEKVKVPGTSRPGRLKVKAVGATRHRAGKDVLRVLAGNDSPRMEVRLGAIRG